MKKSARLQPVTSGVEYDLLLCACGYEERSRFVPKSFVSQASTRIAIGFDYLHEGSIRANKAWFKDEGFFEWNKGEFPIIDDKSFCSVLRTLLSGVRSRDGARRIAIDVSSFSSIRLAFIIEVVWSIKFDSPLIIDFFYAPGKNYDNLESEVEIQFAGPVTNHFAGWACRPELPVVAIIGLGMEYERSLGAFELINPGIAYTFSSAAVNEKIAKQINRANAGLYPLVPEIQRFTYDVMKPLDCLAQLRSLVTGTLKDGRPVFVPLGPKIFTICSLILASEFHPNVGVWRISTGCSGVPVDIVARGDISSFSVVFC
jgi:hypothetical protein